MIGDFFVDFKFMLKKEGYDPKQYVKSILQNAVRKTPAYLFMKAASGNQTAPAVYRKDVDELKKTVDVFNPDEYVDKKCIVETEEIDVSDGEKREALKNASGDFVPFNPDYERNEL